MNSNLCSSLHVCLAPDTPIATAVIKQTETLRRSREYLFEVGKYY